MMQNELYHHGVEGMSWGKRNGPPYPLNAKGKADLRKQKKQAAKLEGKAKEDYKVHKHYNKERAKKAVKRDVAVAMVGGGVVGGAAAGPIGALAGMLGSGLATTVVSSAVNTGRNIVSNSKYKKMLLSDPEFDKAKKSGLKLFDKMDEAVGDTKKLIND